MVRIERIKRPEPDLEADPTGERFKLIEVYVQEPTANPDESRKITARPYEFEGNLPSKFSTSCPQCGQGIWFERCDMRSAVDRFFIACPACGIGTTTPVPPMIDPFLNPVTQKIAETALDSDLSKAQEPIPSDTKTVREKLLESKVDLGGHSPQKDELDEIVDGTEETIDTPEIEQLLAELEGT